MWKTCQLIGLILQASAASSLVIITLSRSEQIPKQNRCRLMYNLNYPGPDSLVKQPKRLQLDQRPRRVSKDMALIGLSIIRGQTGQGCCTMGVNQAKACSSKCETQYM